MASREDSARRSEAELRTGPRPSLRPSGRLSSLRRARASLALRYSPLPSGWISLDLVNYRSSSHRCRCVPFVKAVYQLSAPHPALLRPGPAGRHSTLLVALPSFPSPFCQSFFFFFFPRACAPLSLIPALRSFRRRQKRSSLSFKSFYFSPYRQIYGEVGLP